MKYDIKTGSDGTKYYYVNNHLHREDGPAIEYINGEKHWYKNDLRHREDGPACEFPGKLKIWYLNDKCYGYNDDFTNESWQKFIKTIIFS